MQRKYVYHWMDKDNNLIIRWDNAVHWRNISTFPHHKHVGSASIVLPSKEINMEQVLAYIAKTIGNN